MLPLLSGRMEPTVAIEFDRTWAVVIGVGLHAFLRHGAMAPFGKLLMLKHPPKITNFIHIYLYVYIYIYFKYLIDPSTFLECGKFSTI